MFDNIIPILFPVVFLIMAGSIRVFAGHLDKKRIHEYFFSRSFKILMLNWDPFGPGWLGGNNARIYFAKYKDKDGNLYEASIKTSMWNGVYITNEKLLEAAPHRAKPSYKEENETLKERVRQLEAELAQRAKNG